MIERLILVTNTANSNHYDRMLDISVAHTSCRVVERCTQLLTTIVIGKFNSSQTYLHPIINNSSLTSLQY